MKIKLSAIKKFIKPLSIIILAITVVSFWTIAVLFFTDEFPTEDNCNVGIVRIYGELQTTPNDDWTWSFDVINQLKELNNDKKIKAIVMEINSPGGSQVAAMEIANELETISKPKVAVIKDSGTSAAYYVAVANDYIIASEASDIGSIGVTMSFLDNTDKNRKEGRSFVSLSSGKFKDTGNPDKDLSEEEKALIMRDVNKANDLFMEFVSKRRKLDISKVRQLADGSSMMGQMALVNGLIDEVGDYIEAEKHLSQIMGENLIVCQNN